MGRSDAVTRYSESMKFSVGRPALGRSPSSRVILDFIGCSCYILLPFSVLSVLISNYYIIIFYTYNITFAVEM